MYQVATCASPIVDMIPILLMSTVRSVTDNTEISNPADRFVIVKGIKFTSLHSIDPDEVLAFPDVDPNPNNVAMMIRIWEALVVVPLEQGTTNVPAYLPILSNSNFQSGDLADRVIWKRLSILPFWGVNVANVPQLVDSSRFQPDGGAQVVKSRVRLDDRHGLFYVRNFVHDMVIVDTTSNSSCLPDPVTNEAVIPMQHDGWWKIFYSTRK